MSGLLQKLERLPGELSPRVACFARLLDAETDLEALAARAEALTRQYFGRTMRLFAPLYLSNECVNVCRYCGFSRNHPILRTTLTPEQVEAEARHLVCEGFRNILLVAGEHPKWVSETYLADCVKRLSAFVPSVSIEVGPMEAEPYRSVVAEGAEGLVVYQETYHQPTYRAMHEAGPKKDFAWRLACPERGYEAGFRRLGIGALLGLYDWRYEALALATHTEHLLKHCWKSSITISLPRLRPAAGEFEPLCPVEDRDYVRLVAALRVSFPQVGIVLSTRETPRLRDGLMRLGVTLMSAGVSTEPGGYTGAGASDLHLTVKGRREEVELPCAGGSGQGPFVSSRGRVVGGGEDGRRRAAEQFAISDERSAEEIAMRLRELGLDPVWKDWDYALAPVESGEVAEV